jgi:RNA polymerase sigma-B factor
LTSGPGRDLTVVERDADDRYAERFEQLRRTGDECVRRELIEAHLPLARLQARRFAVGGTSHDDVLQVARLALVMAVDRFDPTRGVSFRTFASRTMEGECKRYLRDRTWAVRPPRNLHELHQTVRRREEMLIQRLGRSPTVDEIAEAVRDTPEHVLEALEAGRARNGLSTDAPAPGRPTGASPLGHELTNGEDRALAAAADRAVLARLTAELDERDRRILHHRFALERTEAEIADHLGVSQSYLSRRLHRILADLRRRHGFQM